MQQFKPLKEWTKEEIQNWFNSFENGLFKEYATKFAKCNGNNLYGFKKHVAQWMDKFYLMKFKN